MTTLHKFTNLLKMNLKNYNPMNRYINTDDRWENDSHLLETEEQQDAKDDAKWDKVDQDYEDREIENEILDALNSHDE